MVVQAVLTEGLLHPQGAKLEMEMANLAAGETRTVPLRVSAAKAGLQSCQVTVAAEGSLDSTAKASVNVVEPLLQIAQSGPAKCLVRAEPTYEITLTNPGTATTDPVGLYAVLPEGFEYVHASDNAACAPRIAVVWKLAGLAHPATKAVTLQLRLVAAGDGLLRTIAQTALRATGCGPAGGGRPANRPPACSKAKTETSIKSEGVAAVRFEVLDLDDPVEVGKEAVYEVRVTNQGTGRAPTCNSSRPSPRDRVQGVERPDAGEGAGPAPGLRADRDARGQGRGGVPGQDSRRGAGDLPLPGATDLRSGPHAGREGRKHPVLQAVIQGEPRPLRDGGVDTDPVGGFRISNWQEFSMPVAGAAEGVDGEQFAPFRPASWPGSSRGAVTGPWGRGVRS